MISENTGLYAKDENFGTIQYLDPNATDKTAISYEKKLQDYLNSVLIGDELAERVRKAFDAYVFLSYRKKDRACRHLNCCLQYCPLNALLY